MYVIMDGFDLGIGILFPFFPQQEERDVMMNTVAPVWDGNETWMVLGGAGLFGHARGAILSNLRVVDGQVTGSSFVGLLAGFLDNSTVSRVSVALGAL
jgi:hypothetical protein